VRFFMTDPHPLDGNGNRRFDASEFLHDCEVIGGSPAK
jgi:hypothetical protein